MARLFNDLAVKAKYILKHRLLEMVRCPSLCFRLVPPRKKKASVSDVGKMLVAIQDMAWQMGYYLEDVPYRESGTHRKEILQKYDLLFKDIRAGSIDIDIVPSEEWQQTTLDEEEATLPGYRAIVKLTAFLEKVEKSDKKALSQLVKNPSYRARLIDDALEIIPSEEGHILHVTGEGNRKFSFKSDHKSKILSLKEPEDRMVGAESRIGVLSTLSVDGEETINLTRCEEKLKANFPVELEPEMRKHHGYPVQIFGQAVRDSGKTGVKEFSVARIQRLEFIEITPFEIESRTFIPHREIVADVDYTVGQWRLSIPGINAVGYGNICERAQDKLREHISILWDEFVECDDSLLGETGILLRKLLLKLFKVE